MKRWLGSISLAVLVAVNSFAAGPAPQVPKFDQKISINAEEITVRRLLQLLDQAAGMQSSIPPELASQTITINFSNLSVSDAVRRIFQKLQFDYVFTPSKGIIVTGASQAAAGTEPVTVSADVQQVDEQPSEEQPAEEKPQPPPPEEPQPIPVIETPFGPIPDSGNSGIIHLPPIPGETSIPFFRPSRPLSNSAAGAPFGPARDNLFRALSILQSPVR
jgi:hypothetical protein